MFLKVFDVSIDRNIFFCKKYLTFTAQPHQRIMLISPIRDVAPSESSIVFLLAYEQLHSNCFIFFFVLVKTVLEMRRQASEPEIGNV